MLLGLLVSDFQFLLCVLFCFSLADIQVLSKTLNWSGRSCVLRGGLRQGGGMCEQLVVQAGQAVVWCGTHLRFPLAPSSSALVAVQRCLVCFVLSFPRVVWSTLGVLPNVVLMTIPVPFKNYHRKGVCLGNHGIWLARRNFLSISCTTMYRSVQKLWSTAGFPSFIPLPSVVEFTFSGAVIRWSFKSEVMTLTYCRGNHCTVSYTKGKWSWIVE